MLQDLRYGARWLARSPVFTLVAVVSVAVAIGAGAAVFAITNAVAFRPLGVGDGHDLYRVFTSDSGGRPYGSSSYADYASFAAVEGIFAATCATDNVRGTVASGGDAALHWGELVSPDCFTALRLRPAHGRFFTAQSLSEAALPVVVSHAVWTRRFGADPNAIGRLLTLNGRPATLVGVAPRGFHGLSLDSSSDFWVPVNFADVLLTPGQLEDRRARRFTIFARLADGVDRRRAEAALAVTAAQLRDNDERAWTDRKGDTRRVTVMRELESRFIQSPQVVTFTLGSGFGAIALILGIGCVNLATMLLARGAARTRELSIRLALGASRLRVLRQLATESLLIATAGSLLGVAAVTVAIRLADRYRPEGIPAFDVAIDWRVTLFAVAAAFVASILFGVAPALHMVKVAVAEGLKGRAASVRVRRLRIGAREALIVLQVTASLAMLLVSTLFLRASMSADTLRPGFNGQGVVTATISFEAIERAAVAPLTMRLLDAAERVPGVARASLAGVVPLAGERTGFEAAIEDGQTRDYFGNVVSPGYFETVRIPIVAGRDFDTRDGATAPRVAIVSETFARQAWQGAANAVGRVITMDKQPVTVVGVVADIRYFEEGEPYQALLYLPTAQREPHRTTLHARVSGNGATIAALERALRDVDPRVAIEAPRSMNARIDAANAPARSVRWAAAGAGGVQLALALMALWGLVTYAIERRAAEWGLRVALGATPRSVVRLSVRPAAMLIAVGVVGGLAVGAMAAQVLRASGMSQVAMDARAAVPLALVFTLVALSAAWWPARKAGMADPSILLRRE